MGRLIRAMSGRGPRSGRWRGHAARLAGAHWLLLAIVCGLAAGELQELSVTDNGGTYHIRTVMWVDAPADQVYKVLTDFEHIYRLNPSITESEVLPPAEPGTTRVRTLIEDCVWFRCLKINRMQSVHEDSPWYLRVETDPRSSDFKSATTEWWVLPYGDEATKVIYDAQMTPDFYLPPVVGRFVLKIKLRESVVTSFERLECIARINAGLVPRGRIARDGYPYTEHSDCDS